MGRASAVKQTNATSAAPERQAVTKTQAAAEARDCFERRIGSLDMGLPMGADNESIDADLAREYATKHDPE